MTDPNENIPPIPPNCLYFEKLKEDYDKDQLLVEPAIENADAWDAWGRKGETG